MVRQSEADFHLRETMTRPRNILHTPVPLTRESTGLRTNFEAISYGVRSYPSWNSGCQRKLEQVNLDYPAPVRDTAKSGMGVRGNRHLNYFAESFLMNLGGLHRDAKVSSPLTPCVSVGAAIVIRGWNKPATW